MSNKSSTTRGLSRLLEEKADKLQDDLSNFRKKHVELEERYNDKTREVTKLQDQIQEAVQDADIRIQRLKDNNDSLRHEQDIATRKCASLHDQAQEANRELQRKSEEKEMLHSRHDALTAESQLLQRDASKTRMRMQELEDSLRDEKQYAQENDRRLREEAKRELDRLSEHIDFLHRELEDKESQHAADHDQWDSEKRGLQSQKERAEEQASGLQRTISKLQEAEGTMSGREMKLHEALESEKQRHGSEEAVLGRQIQELTAEIDDKRKTLEELRSDLSQTREDLRVNQRDQADLEEKVQSLEDEVEVLQNGLDEESEKAREEVNAIEQEVVDLRAELVTAKEKLFHAKDELGRGAAPEDNKVINDRLQETAEKLRQIRAEKQLLQNDLAKLNSDMHTLQLSSTETGAERDELKSQLIQMQNQVDATYQLDQEKVNLRTSNLRLENDVGRLREERKGLLDKITASERELEAEIARAVTKEGQLNQELADLKSKLAQTSGCRDRELNSAKQKIQRLEAQVEEYQIRSTHNEQEDVVAELSMTHKDLSVARRKEAEYLQREAAQKEIVRELKRKITRLEQQSHELEVARLNAESPRSSVAGSARKNELLEIQRQLTDAHQQLRDTRSRSRDELKILQRRLADVEQHAQTSLDAHEQQREQLETELSTVRHEQEILVTKNHTTTQTVARLRARISSLEKELQAHRQATTVDNTIVEERKDLHEMLKDAKLTAEDLQVQIASRESQLAASSSREKELRLHLRRVREERTRQTQTATALSKELENLQVRYERTVENLSRQQRKWEEERKALTSRVRFANTSMSSVHVDENQNLELVNQHAAELWGLAKQIQWLRAKCEREEGFRWGLVFEKRYMQKQIQMFETWYVIAVPFLEFILTPRMTATKWTFSCSQKWVSTLDRRQTLDFVLPTI